MIYIALDLSQNHLPSNIIEVAFELSWVIFHMGL